MSVLICGSFAYDNLMLFKDKFSNYILPDKLDALNICFMTPDMQREFGGCAGNIAFNLGLLGVDPIPMGTVGKDFTPYRSWLCKNNIDDSYLKIIEDAFTAQAYIVTDINGNQITLFHPGAMAFSHYNQVTDPRLKHDAISAGIISPDGRDGMLRHASQFVEAGIPFIFDPGQGLPMFSKKELESFFRQAKWIAVNYYEWQLIQEISGVSSDDLARQVDALFVTHGADGSVIYTSEGNYEIPAARPARVVDPTGCGDAYRAGLLYGIVNGMDWETTGRLASLMGAIKIESKGTQNHRCTMSEFRCRYQENFSATF